MMMIELTSVPSAALPVVDLSAQLRLSSGFADDGSQTGALESCLRAALSAVEARIGKALLRRRFQWQLSHWSASEAQVLPLAPVAAVEQVALISRTGVAEVVAPDRYDLVMDAHRPVLRGRGAGLPKPEQGGLIEVEITAGFGPDWSAIPADLRQAVLILAAAFYNGQGAGGGGLPFAVSVLIEPHRTLRLRGDAG